MDSLIFQSAARLALAIRSREVSACEVLDAHLVQVEKHNSTLNAIVTLDADGARRRAAEADAALSRGELWGPLHGVPMAIKDAWGTAGMRTTSSHLPLKDFVPEQDATVVARLKAVGAIVFGKTNLPALAADVQTRSPIFGPANNPFDLERTPGGSTGGGAAALASGMSPLEVGSDLGGSIRLPAHFCGLYGLKATAERIPLTGHLPGLSGTPVLLLRSMISAGPLARSAADLHLAVKILAGPDGRDAGLPPVLLDEKREKSWSDYRIAVCEEWDAPVSKIIKDEIIALATNLSRLSCRVENARPEFSLSDALEAYGILLGAGLGIGGPPIPLPRWVLRRQARKEKDNYFGKGFLFGLQSNLREYNAALVARARILSLLEEFLSGYDAFLLPVSSSPAFQHIPWKSSTELQKATVDVDGRPVQYHVASQSYTLPFNLTGSPVLVLPIGRSAQGLPFGIQLVGKRWSESTLLALGEKISREITGPFVPPSGY